MIEFQASEGEVVGRRRSILETLGHGGHVEVSKLAELFQVSSVTIRKDLKALEARNLLKRVRGGAVAVQRTKYEFEIVEPGGTAKEAMARTASRLVEEGDVVLLDAGSTVFALAQQLPAAFRELTVITNSVPVMALLSKRSGFNLVGLGGKLHAFSMAQVGPITVRQLRDMRATRMFFSATGATMDRGLWIPDVVEAETKEAMLAVSAQRIALLERAKLDGGGMAPFAHWRDVDCLITDRPLPQGFADRLRQQHVRLMPAGVQA